MLLFQKRFLDGIVDGSISLTFRRWEKSRVKPGGRYRVHPIGVVVVDDVRRIEMRQVKPADAKRAGFCSRAEMIEYMTRDEEPLPDDAIVFRIEFHHDGEADYALGAMSSKLTKTEVAAIVERLRGHDERSSHGAWTRETLQLIAANPRIAASRLAKIVGRETLPFKADVRKLKQLGLTQSFEVGYDLTPRGKAFVKKQQ